MNSNDVNNRLVERVQRLESGLEFLRDRVSSCIDDGYQSDSPCGHCDYCTVNRLLKPEPYFEWRYRGYMHARIEHNPRERRIIHAFAERVKDEEFQLIMGTGNPVNARDWLVASTIVQWLATNVGMGVLEQAGFEYKRFEEDRKLIRDKSRKEGK